jgi:hypothetical protein
MGEDESLLPSLETLNFFQRVKICTREYMCNLTTKRNNSMEDKTYAKATLCLYNVLPKNQ